MPENNYKQIARSTGIMGFSQSIQIGLKIINTKCIALFLGPAGIGLMGILQSTLNLIGSVSGMGLGQSAVRDVAFADKNQDKTRIAFTAQVLKRLIFIMGIAGTVFTFFFSALLSKWVFHDSSHTSDFRILSIVIFFSQVTAGMQAMIQGKRRIKDFAMSSVISPLLMMTITIPLFYFYGTSAIIPAIIIGSIASMLSAFYFYRRIAIERISLNLRQIVSHGKYMLKFGFATMISGFFLVVSMYLVRLLINNTLGVFYVGIFQAAWGITMTYMQMIFQAMSKDYYPRLTSVSESETEINKMVNEQLHIAILLAAPMIAITLFVSPWLVYLLYSSAFNNAVPLFQWLLIGTLLKVFIWPVAFILPAMRAGRAYIITEAIGSMAIWAFSYLLIPEYGIEAIGIAYLLSYLVYMAVVFLTISRLIYFRLNRTSLQLMLISVVFISFIFCLRYMFQYNYLSIAISFILALSLCIGSYLRLDELIGIKNFVRKFLMKNTHD